MQEKRAPMPMSALSLNLCSQASHDCQHPAVSPLTWGHSLQDCSLHPQVSRKA